MTGRRGTADTGAEDISGAGMELDRDTAYAHAGRRIGYGCDVHWATGRRRRGGPGDALPFTGRLAAW